MGYIYKITNLVNGNIYIGQTKRHYQQRWKEHIYRSARIDETSQSICKAIHKYGKENFLFEVLEECDDEILSEREIYYIDYYDSYNNGYNATPGGETGIFLQTGIPVCQWDMNGNFIRKWRTAQSVEEEYGWAHEDILRCCRGERITSHSYLWTFSEDIAPVIRDNRHYKKVALLDDNKNIIKVYNKIADASKELNIASTHISRACKKGYRAGGHYWKYITDEKEKNN